MKIPSICSYCAVGCGVNIRVAGGRIISVEGDTDYPVNRGMLCTKGRSLHKTVYLSDRLNTPQLRTSRNQPLREVTWDEAIATSAEKLAAIIREHGPDAVAFYVSGQLLTEDYYVFNKLMKGFIGSNNIDSNSRLCMSSAVAGYKRAFGVDGPPGCYDDIELTDNLFLFGANPAYAHPILFRRIEAAREANPDMRVIVADPRRTDSCSLANLHLPVRPGTDVALLLAMLNVLLWENCIDPAFVDAHTSGFDATAAEARAMTPRKAAEICGVEAGAIVQAAHWFAEGKTMSMWTMGFNQSASGVDKNNALINLHLATGQIGKAGTGPFSLTGQPNAMGGREVGGLANLLPGHRDLSSEKDCAEVAALWGGKPIRPRNGKTAVDLFAALETGEIRAVWIVGTNPAVSMPNARQVRKGLASAEWVMVSDIVPTETTSFADVILPAAGWGEKEGTMTNAERRIARVRKAVDAPGEAKPDWWAAAQIAQALGKQLGETWQDAFGYVDTAAIFEEHKRLLSGKDCDISALRYEGEVRTGLQWPIQTEGQGTTRLYENHRFETPDGRARFIPVSYRAPARPLDEQHQLILTTGRYRDQWHTMTKTGRVAELNVHEPRACLDMHPSDADRRRIQPGDLVEIRSEIGDGIFPVRVTTDIAQGVVFLPMHQGAFFRSGGMTNELVFPDTDPISRQPEFKRIPIALHPARMGAFGTIITAGNNLAPGRELLAIVPYGNLFLHGSPPLIVAEYALRERCDEDGERFDAIIAGWIDKSQTLLYRDDRRGDYKRVWMRQGRLIAIHQIAEKPADFRTCLPLFSQETAELEKSVREWFHGAGGGATPSCSPLAPRWGKLSATVCVCMGVDEERLSAAIAQGARTVKEVQRACSAGTGCGSCIPQIRRYLDKTVPAGAV